MRRGLYVGNGIRPRPLPRPLPGPGSNSQGSIGSSFEGDDQKDAGADGDELVEEFDDQDTFAD